jgi:uncharacterized protein YuzE
MSKPIFNYDEESDTLYVSFVPGEAATGIALNDHMLLRLNISEKRVVGLTLLNYSIFSPANRTRPSQFSAHGRVQGSPASTCERPALSFCVHAVVGRHGADRFGATYPGYF